MKKIIALTLLLTALAVFSGCSQPVINEESGKPVIITSILPTRTFVEKVVGDAFEVVAIVPPGASPSNYQPTPGEMVKMSEADYYFSIAVPTEVANILPKIPEFNEDVHLVELNEAVAEVYPERFFEAEDHEDHDEEGDPEDHSHEGRDPHIWLSPLRAMEMVKTISDVLVADHPEMKQTLETNRDAYLLELEDLHQHIQEETGKLSQRAFIIYHPSYGYFADDYGFDMLAIENEGKEENAKGIEEIIDYAKDQGIKVIFYQAEFDSEQAETIAGELGGITRMLTPLSPDYIQSMKETIDTFKEVQ